MTLDLAMPGLGGIDVLKALRRRGGPMIPVVVVSAFSPAHGARAVDALAEGAFELVPKPTGTATPGAFEQSLLSKIKLAARTRRPSRRRARPLRRRQRKRQRPRRSTPASSRTVASGAAMPPWRRPRPAAPAAGVTRALLIATSTGGPRALAARCSRRCPRRSGWAR